MNEKEGRRQRVKWSRRPHHRRRHLIFTLISCRLRHHPGVHGRRMRTLLHHAQQPQGETALLGDQQSQLGTRAEV